MASGLGGVCFVLYFFAIYLLLSPQFLHFELPECSNYDVLTGKWIILTQDDCSRFGGLNILLNRTSRHYDQVKKETVILSPPTGLKNNLNFSMIALLLSGDVLSLNPGPIHFPCVNCNKPVRKNQHAIQCDSCDQWTHRKCTTMSIIEYEIIGNSDKEWLCTKCPNPQPNASMITENSDAHVNNEPTGIEQADMRLSDIDNTGGNSSQDVFDQVREVREKHRDNFIAGHLNINSLRHKFVEIKELMTDKLIDLMFISETKLDSSFLDGTLEAEGYRIERRDRNQHGGGIAAYIRGDLPSRRRKDLEHEGLENIACEVLLNKRKWILLCAYRPPSMSDSMFIDLLSKSVDKCLLSSDHILIMGEAK